ncbi:50S ribosomal protein L9 [Peptostreptococcaceae bacterium AGR-M142]
MKVILLKNIKGTGKMGDVIEASDGYARNYLLPRKLAKEANNSNMKELNEKNTSKQIKEEKEHEEALKLKEKMNDIEVVIFSKAGEGGKLFGSITSKEIAENLKKKHGIEVDKRKVSLKDPIKVLGTTKVDVKIHPKVVATVSVIAKEKNK